MTIQKWLKKTIILLKKKQSTKHLKNFTIIKYSTEIPKKKEKKRKPSLKTQNNDKKENIKNKNHKTIS